MGRSHVDRAIVLPVGRCGLCGLEKPRSVSTTVWRLAHMSWSVALKA